MIMDQTIKEQLIKSVSNIKNKIKTIEREENAANLKFKKVFKPITDNLESLIKGNDNKDKPAINFSIDMTNSNISNSNEDCVSSEYEDSKEMINVESDENLKYFDYNKIDDKQHTFENDSNTQMTLRKEDIHDFCDNNINVPFGIRCENQNLMMGDSKVSFSYKINASNPKNNCLVTINDNKHFELTPGLKELLMCNKPNLDMVTEIDKIVYKDMLHITNAHKRGYISHGQLKGDKGFKYNKIIKPLFSEQTTKDITHIKSGGSLPKFKKYKKNTDYIFWDDPNELIERLKLLIASKNAGNTNHDNEIISIIEELQEAGIIK